jgi:putative oxidoreductase
MNKKNYGQMLLRVGAGVLFLGAGLMKLFGPGAEGITGMLSGIGFPLAGLFAWFLILAEIVGGGFLIAGYQVKWSSATLFVILLVAIVTVGLGNVADTTGRMNLLKDLGLLTGLAAIFLNGPGCWCFDKKHHHAKA